MKLCNLITELQSIADRFGDCDVQIANDRTSILDGWDIDRVCFFLRMVDKILQLL
jgi:hypothetical protein